MPAALDDFINSVKTLPPAPRVLPQLLALLQDEDAPSDHIVDLIQVDPALTAKVLQCCNSAAFGLAQPVSDLDGAVTLLGFNRIYRLVTLVIGAGLLSSEQPGYGIAHGKLWEHSVTVGFAARTISRTVGANDGLAFTAGLLHDIGKLVLSMFLDGSADLILKRTSPSGLSLLETEQSILGVEHAEIGGRLLARWNFPESFVQAVWHHHNPAEARPYDQLAALIHLGDIVAHCLGHAPGYSAFAVEAQENALKILDLRPEQLDGFIVDTDAALKECTWLKSASK